MRTRERRKPAECLWQATVYCGREAEQPVTALVEHEFQQSSSIYLDERTGRCRVSVYLSDGAKPDKASCGRLIAGLDALRGAGVLRGRGHLKLTKLRLADWAESWKRHFRPMEVGSELLIKPSWSKRKPLPGQALVVLDPGLAFGTGQHPTTSFCLQQIVLERRTITRASFLDIGMGSAILAIAAAKVGYHPVEAFDHDPACLIIARENARRNGVTARLRLSCRDVSAMPRRSVTKFHLVCANVIFDVLVRERQRIVAQVARDGRLVLAGILRTQFASLREAYEELGMKLVRHRAEKEWASGTFVFV